MVFKTIVSLVFILFILVLLACKDNNHVSNNLDIQLKLKQVVEYASSHKSEFPDQFQRSAQFPSFDFSKLIPLENTSLDNRIDVFYNHKAEIAKIIVKSVNGNDKFEFNFIKNSIDNYTIIYISYVTNSGVREHVEGFIFNYKQSSYFITFNNDPFCVMTLDSNLQVISTLRTLKFYPDSLYFKTRVNYREGSLLDSETFYVPQSPLANSASTLVEDVVNQFSSNLGYDHEMELKLGIAEPDKYLPLWLWNGHQQYDIEVTPITKSIEIHE